MRIDPDQFRRIGETSPIDEQDNYVVLAEYKDEPGEPFVKFEGTYADCDDYAQRNESPDNNERYAVAQRVACPKGGVVERVKTYTNAEWELLRNDLKAAQAQVAAADDALDTVVEWLPAAQEWEKRARAALDEFESVYLDDQRHIERDR